MKLFRYMACGLLVAGSLTVFTACEDDNNLGEAPRLFSPVVNVTTNANAIECKWNGIQGATSYILTLQRELTTTDDSGAALAEDVRTVTVNVDPTGVSHFSPIPSRISTGTSVTASPSRLWVPTRRATSTPASLSP